MLSRVYKILNIIKDKIFDEEFYLQQYPDVAESGIDPFVHYIKFGRKEGRKFSEKNSIVKCLFSNTGVNKRMRNIIKDKIFDEDFYLRQYPDVAESGIDPLMHYINNGWSSKRIPRENISGARLERIPSNDYALLGEPQLCSLLLSEMQRLGVNRPTIILDDSFNEQYFKDIPVKCIADFKAGSLPVVIAPRQNVNIARNAFIKKTKGFTKFIDLFSPDFSNEQKVFCIGYGKTGTTSTLVALHELGYSLGNQAIAELLVFDWAKNDYSRIIDFCKSANAFQDIPFSCDRIYESLDEAFPNSKFILTVRDSSEQWFDSLCRFHTKLFSKDKSATPTIEDLKQANYRYDGYSYDSWVAFWEESLYDKETYISRYENHNCAVKKYFSDKPEQLLVINIAEQNAYLKLCDFLGKKPLRLEFPWENKT